MIKTQVLKQLPEQDMAREKGENEMSGEEQLPQEQWGRAGISGSLRGRSEEETKSNNSSPRG